LSEPNADNRVLTYNNTTNAPEWTELSTVPGVGYTLEVIQTGGNNNNPSLSLSDGSTDDNVQIIGGSNVTVTRNNDFQLTISATTSVDSFQNNNLSGGSVTLNPTIASVFRVGLNASPTTITIEQPLQTANTASAILVFVDNRSTNNASLIWANGKSGGTIKFPGGTTPSRSTGANKMDLWVFNTFDQGTTWYGLISVYEYQT